MHTSINLLNCSIFLGFACILSYFGHSLRRRQITSLNGPAQVQKKTTIIQRSKTEMPRPDTIESGEVFTASPSQRKTSDGMSPKPPSIPKREDSASSMDKDRNTEKADKEKVNDDTAAEDGDKDEKTGEGKRNTAFVNTHIPKTIHY